MSQCQIGYMLQQKLAQETGKQVVTIVTQVLVDEKDPAFRKPTKFVGPFYSTKKKGMVWDSGRGYRKVVASPQPKRIIESRALKSLIKAGVVVIASGGGGIPVKKTGKGLKGVNAVIDKDLAAERLADVVKADFLLILTAVPAVYIGFNTRKQQIIRKIKVPLLEKYVLEGQFPSGSMGPKVRAALRFLSRKDRRVVITSPGLAWKGFQGKAGTVISR
jgi:carbamate kinase